MKQIIFICSLFILLQVSFNANSATNNSRNRNQTDSIKCEIKGSVINRPDSKEAIIIEALRDQRVNKHFRVPIIDGKYSFTLCDDFPRCYSVFFDDEERAGNIRIRNFYTGNGYVDIISQDE